MMKEGSVAAAPIGIRINSQYGVGSIESTSTVSSTSKFGLPIKDTPFKDLLAIFSKWPALNCLHSHVGSQGIDLSMMVGGVKFVVDLADKINSQLGRKQVGLCGVLSLVTFGQSVFSHHYHCHQYYYFYYLYFLNISGTSLNVPLIVYILLNCRLQ